MQNPTVEFEASEVNGTAPGDSGLPRRAMLAGLGGLAAGVLLAGGREVQAGPLEPPLGPISSTGRTLTEVEPRTPLSQANTPGDANSVYRIALPGSYFLTSNLAGVSGKHGIKIEADNVTIDLRGFSVIGVPGSITGIHVEGTRNNLAIRNGKITGWSDAGMNLVGVSASANAIVEDILARANGATGIRVSNNAVLRRCAANGNGVNLVSSGIVAFTNAAITDCVSRGNTGNGIAAGEGAVLRNCSVFSNSGSGIAVGQGSVVVACSVRSNNQNGVSVGDGSLVADCASNSNRLDGILISGDCTVRGNSCDSNGNGGDGAGIHATGSDNRIEANNCTDSDRGIDIDSAGNIIIRNSCSGNTTDWDFVANNVYGPIIDRRVPLSPAVAGFSAASTLASTDANANYSF